MTPETALQHDALEPAALGGGTRALLFANLRRASRTHQAPLLAGEIDRLLGELEAGAGADAALDAAAELRVREFCFRHGLLSVLALSGMPLVYDFRRSFDENAEGPWAVVPDVDPSAETARVELLGTEVGFPIGVAASALTATARYIEFYARHGFNVLTYKTVRSRRTEPHPFPNWVYVNDLGSPLPFDQLAHRTVVGDEETYLSDPCAYSTANSFGVPSPEPSVWQHDVARSLEVLGDGKLLIVSVMGTAEDDGAGLARDFAEVALLAEEAGASAIELNLSCPNTLDYHGPGMMPPISDSPDATRAIVDEVRGRIAATTRLVVKLGYLPKQRLADIIGPIAGAVDAVSGINTVAVRVVRPDGEPTFKGASGAPDRDRPDAGLSGVAIRTLGQDFVRHVAELRNQHGWDLAIIGMGGVMTPDDVLALRSLGADAVQTATAASHNPRLAAQAIAAERSGVSENDALERVTRELRRSEWRYRTVEGLAEDSGLDPAVVRGILDRHPELVRWTALRDAAGRPVIVPKDRPRSGRELLAGLRDLLTV